MYHRREIKLLLAICFLFILGIAVCLFGRYEQSLCMGVRVVSPDFLEKYTEVFDLDISQLTFNDEKAAVDLANNRMYISQSPGVLSSFHELQGNIGFPASQYSLYFVNDQAMENLADTVREGNPLSLVILSGSNYLRMDVVISTLPVLRMDGVVTHLDEEGRNVLTGGLTLWSGFDPTSESYTVQSCSVEWHLRGGTTSGLAKKPWKLSLKNKAGGNYDCNFLGAGADDDWILNPMSMDDTKLREKFTMDFWNAFVSTTGMHFQMSTGEYVEVVINGEYQGLYLLQRRVDEKYLQLDRNKDILLKGKPTWIANTVQEGYEIVFSPYNEEQTYEILYEALAEENNFEITLQNFIDVSLLLNYGMTPDNTGYKNMFYVLKATDQGYLVSLVPWDTDMSFGVTWKDRFVCDFDTALNLVGQRMEYSLMKKRNSTLDQLIAARWQELRATVYTADAIGQLLTDNIDTVHESGAFERDVAKWGCLYGGEDGQDKLYRFCMDRLTWLDQYYSQ